MNIKKLLNKIIIIILLGFCITNVTQAQEKNEKKDKKKEIENLIQAKNFAFIAQSASPAGGRLINLTSTYDLVVANDTVISELPYYGRSYVAPIDSRDAGIRFNSTENTINIEQKKKGGWDITISPKNSGDVKTMYLSVGDGGYASLQVISNNRQQITFSGYVTDRSQLK